MQRLTEASEAAIVSAFVPEKQYLPFSYDVVSLGDL